MRGKGHGRHTTSTTLQQSTREGGTKGADEKDSTTHHSTWRTATHPRAHKHRTGTTHTAHTHTRAHSRWTAGPAAHPENRQQGEGDRQNPDAPHNGGEPAPPGTAPRHPRGRQPPTGHANQGDSAGPPHPHIRAQSTWVANPDSPFRGWAARGGGAPELRRPSQRRKAPPPGDALLPPPQRATTARKSARCRAGARSPRPHQPHPGHTGRGTPAARPKGRAAGGETAPDTRRPSPRWKATPSADGCPPAPGYAAPHRACKPTPMIVAAVFPQNSKSCIFRTAISNCRQ